MREQLAWLDREIARETTGTEPAIGVTVPPPVSIAAAGVVPVRELDAYTPDPVSAARDTRRGCLIAVAIIVILITAAFTALYFWRYSDRPLIFPSAETSGPATPAK
ncbi:MAG: hypothetical protein ABIZ04_11070 [Opitutus sp.]